MALLIHAGFRPREAARAVLLARGIENGVCEHTGQGLQSLEKTGLVRVLLFCLGTLPQVDKLMALSGVPWTKAWAGMYLGSFVTVEILLFMAEKQDENAKHTIFRFDLRHFRHLLTIETVLGKCSIGIHLLFGASAYYQILSEHTTNNNSYLEHYRSWIISIAVLSIIFFMEAIPQGAKVLVAKFSTPSRIMDFYWPTYSFNVLAFFILPIISFINHAEALFYHTIYMSCFFGFLWVLSFLSPLSNHVQINVLFLEHELDSFRHSRMRATDFPMSFNACAFFVGTFSLSVAWYSTCYDAIGTHKPEWVNALG